MESELTLSLMGLADDGCPNIPDMPGNRYTYDEQVEAFLSLVPWVRSRAGSIKKDNYSLELEDIIASLDGGVWQATGRFDPTYGAKFITYASHWMRRWISDYMQTELAKGIYVPQYQGKMTFPRVSLDYAEKNDRPVHETIPARKEDEPDIDIPEDFWETVRSNLSEREYQVIEMRFKEGLTLKQCGERMGGVTKERMRQVEARALMYLSVRLRRILT